MGFYEDSSSGLTAMQIHSEQTRCNFEKGFEEQAGRVVAPRGLIKVTERQSSKSVLWFGEILALRNVCSRSFLLIFFFMLLFLHYYAATKSWKSRAASSPLGNMWGSLCARLMQMHQHHPPHSSQAAVGWQIKHKSIHSLCLSQKMHKWPLKEISSWNRQKLKTVVLILAPWQVHRRNRSRNTERTKSLD